MRGAARLSPTGRGLAGVADRMAKLEIYERWRTPTRVDFEAVLGVEGWAHYWSLCEGVIGSYGSVSRSPTACESQSGTRLGVTSL